MKGKRPSPAMIVAACALVLALGGTAVAAGRYIITSSSQIKPSVLRELRSEIAHAAEIKVAATGVHTVVARAKLAAPVALTDHSQHTLALSGATWTQHPEELQVVMGGYVTLSFAPQKCENVRVRFFITVDGKPSPAVEQDVYVGEPHFEHPTATATIPEYGALGASGWFPERPVTRSHTISVAVQVRECYVSGESEPEREATPFSVSVEHMSVAVFGLK